MKLAVISSTHVLRAAGQIDYDGIPRNSLNNNYWVTVGQREYPFKHLTNEAYKLASNTTADLDFQSTKPYRNYLKDLGFDITYYPQNINFFKNYEIEDFIKVAGKEYRKSNSENLRYSKLIQPNIKKLNYWASNALVEDFNAKLDHTWQWSGTFKSYLWIRIYRKGDSQKVYFVLGVDEMGNLTLQLNCQRSNHSGGKTKALAKSTVNVFDKYLSESDYSEKSISRDKLKNYNWHSLIELAQNYLYKYGALYDELENLTKTQTSGTIYQEKFKLFPSQPPVKTKSYVNRKRSFTGRKTDWSRKQYVSSKLGMLGEELVIRNEKQKLEQLGFPDKAEKVQKKLDGEGYDILSFDENGNEIFIEVKTTTGSYDEPFYLSINEKEFCDLYSHKYIIYRLHDYNYQNKTANFFTISGLELSDFELSPTNFEVSKK